MEVLVYEDTKEVEANFAVEDDLSTVIVKKKRRVSFAQTQTIHVIPRHDDIETPPLLNSDPLLGKSELANPRVFAEQQSATPRASVAVHDLPLHDNSMDFSHFTSDMDTGHGSWADEDFPSRRDSFVGLEDDSGCFVHLGHISRIEDDDSIVNDVFNDDMTMDATTFTKNLSQYLNSGTTFDLQGAGHSGQVMNLLNDCDTRSEDDSMALTKAGAPHWALINPQDVSMHADDDQSDMSLATESDRVRAKKRRSSLAANKLSFSNAAEHPTPGFAGKSTSFANKQKENLAPRKFQDGLSSSSPRLVPDPHCDSNISMSLTNTMDTSLSQSCPRQSLVLTKIDGNSQTPPTSRRRSDTIMQDTSLSVSDINTTLPIRNLKDLLLDHTDYTITRKIQKEAEFSYDKISDSYSLRLNGPGTVSSVKQEYMESQGSDLAGLHASERREVIVDNWQNMSTAKAEEKLGLISNVGDVQLTDIRQNLSNDKVDVEPAPDSKLEMLDADSASDKKMTEDARTSSQGFKQPITGDWFKQPITGDSRTSSQGFKQLITGSHFNARNREEQDAKQHHSGNDEKSIRVSSQSSLLQVKPVSLLSRNNSRSTSVAAERSDSQIQSEWQDCESKSELMEVNKPVKGQRVFDSSTPSILVEPRSHNKRSNVLDGKVHIFLEESRSHSKAKQNGKDNLVQDRNNHQPSITAKVALLEEPENATISKVPAGLGTTGRTSWHRNLNASRSLKEILIHIQDRSHVTDDQTEEENVVQLPPKKLQTLSDYLQFSCSVQPQMDWLSEHIQELEVKLHNAKKRNTEMKTCDASAQKYLEESPHTLKAKFASKHRLAKKGWILWKLDAKRKVLSWLQESKDNLMKEVEAAEMKGQQVLHLKVLYSQIAPKMDFNEPTLDLSEKIANIAATRETAQLSTPHQLLNLGDEKERKVLLQSTELEDRHHQYQEACNQLSDLTSKWNKLQIEIQSITSAHSHVLQTERDNTSLEDNLKALMRKLELTNNLLQQQQVMHLSVENKERTSIVKFSLGGMYFQSFQFGGDNWSSQVQISRSLHPEAIEMAFPCMEAPSFFHYLHSDLHCMASVELQHLYRIIQKTNQLLGSLMDVLEEINFCRRNFGISCKFQILNGEPLLNMTFLQCQSGVRVILTFEMTGVKGGTYPFDLKPADIQIQTYGSPGGTEVITRTDMLSRIAKIQHGYGRLARICSCFERSMRT